MIVFYIQYRYNRITIYRIVIVFYIHYRYNRITIYRTGSEISFLHLVMFVLSNPRVGSTLLSIQITNRIILEVIGSYGT